jgi:PAS domain S-box-containing protein
MMGAFGQDASHRAQAASEPGDGPRDPIQAILIRALEVADIGLYLVDLDRQEIHLSAEMAHLLRAGDAPIEMELDAFRSRFYHPDDADSVRAQAHDAYTQSAPVWMDGRMIRADGEVIHAHSRMSLYPGPNGERRFLGIVQDVTRQVRADQAIRLAAETLSEIIMYAPLGVVRIGNDMTFLQANPSFAALMRTTVEELDGAPVSRFFPPSEIARASDNFREITGEVGIIADFDTQATRGDGTTVWVHWTASTVRRANGEVDYYLVMFEDISARRAAEEVAAANLEVLRRLNKVKSQFLTKVSHEFRTALVGIQGFSEYIRQADTLEVEDVKAFATDIYDDAVRLDRTLNDMLELDRSEAGRGDLHLTDVDLADLIRDAVVSAMVGSSDHAIQADLHPVPMVIADPELVLQVVASLLSRALDYSPVGAPILVTARVSGAEVQVAVRDSGPAFAADLEAQLLGRVAPAVVRDRIRVLESNVGLPMARQIVEMHGGRIWFEVDAATVWCFSLPISKSPTQSATGSG